MPKPRYHYSGRKPIRLGTRAAQPPKPLTDSQRAAAIAAADRALGADAPVSKVARHMQVLRRHVEGANRIANMTPEQRAKLAPPDGYAIALQKGSQAKSEPAPGPVERAALRAQAVDAARNPPDVYAIALERERLAGGAR